MDDKFLGKYKNIRELSFGLAVYSSTSIFGPLILIGGAGYFLDKFLGTKPWILVISIFVAFLVTNFLLFKKVVNLNKWISQEREKRKAADSQDEKNNIE